MNAVVNAMKIEDLKKNHKEIDVYAKMDIFFLEMLLNVNL